MELLKKINNNYCIAKDSNGNRIIVSGKGIGFIKMPYILNDLSKIDRTFYDVDDRILNLISKIPEEILNLSLKSVDYASGKLGKKLNPNFYFTLADHLNFAIKRINDGIQMNYGITYEMEYLHSDEMEIATKIVHVINDKLKLNLPKSETAIIAMHIVEAQNVSEIKHLNSNVDEMADEIIKIVSRELGISVNRKSFNYYRFVTHIQYLIERLKTQSEISSENKLAYENLCHQFPESYACVEKIKQYLRKQVDVSISDEESLYLLIHINRLCSKEDCNS